MNNQINEGLLDIFKSKSSTASSECTEDWKKIFSKVNSTIAGSNFGSNGLISKLWRGKAIKNMVNKHGFAIFRQFYDGIIPGVIDNVSDDLESDIKNYYELLKKKGLIDEETGALKKIEQKNTASDSTDNNKVSTDDPNVVIQKITGRQSGLSTEDSTKDLVSQMRKKQKEDFEKNGGMVSTKTDSEKKSDQQNTISTVELSTEESVLKRDKVAYEAYTMMGDSIKETYENIKQSLFGDSKSTTSTDSKNTVIDMNGGAFSHAVNAVNDRTSKSFLKSFYNTLSDLTFFSYEPMNKFIDSKYIDMQHMWGLVSNVMKPILMSRTKRLYNEKVMELLKKYHLDKIKQQ